MSIFSVDERIKFTRVMNAVAAGTSTQNSSSVDMQNYKSVTFVCALGDITATGVPALTVEQSMADATFNALVAGVTVSYTDADDNKLAIAEVIMPKDRYVRAAITRATANAVIDGVIAMQARAEETPVTHDTTVVGSTSNVSPAEA